MFGAAGLTGEPDGVNGERVENEDMSSDFVSTAALVDAMEESDSELQTCCVSLYCEAENCERPKDGNVGGQWCAKHRRALKFSSALSDALMEFLGPVGKNRLSLDTKIGEAGETFAIAMELLFNSIFPESVNVNTLPLVWATSENGKERIAMWRVNFWWELAEKIDGAAIQKDWQDDDE